MDVIALLDVFIGLVPATAQFLKTLEGLPPHWKAVVAGVSLLAQTYVFYRKLKGWYKQPPKETPDEQPPES